MAEARKDERKDVLLGRQRLLLVVGPWWKEAATPSITATMLMSIL